ncbi:hypothetical protein CHS0354_006848 [Potamilus streckersoni]|uniref:Glycine cleavage system H protein n=1 Tax=Potamilus streckersoni TaxID=2493646 RepID=A0AAE0WCS6_9BIVA|nr:hypothetical protein CHS0354_006848 [Potamilus streckersoni]
MSSPQDFLYTKDHEWVDVSGSIATVGISDHAQQSLGDIVFVELPEIGTIVDTGEQIGSIESVKAVSELYSPVSGEVIEVNKDLEDAPIRIVNISGYTFADRHAGPDAEQIQEMLGVIGLNSAEELVKQTVPSSILMNRTLNLPPAMSEAEFLTHMEEIALKNQRFKNFIGLGYYHTYTPSVIRRCIFEIRAGIHSIPPIRRKFHRDVWKHSLTSRRWSAT